MSKFSSFIYVDYKAEIQCAGCGTVEDASCGSEGEAERNLVSTLGREGWQVIDGVPHCSDGVPHCSDCVSGRRKRKGRA
jgi:hypothetical protein